MIEHSEIRQLIPHQGEMCLLNRVLEWHAGRIVLASDSHRSPTNPLRSSGVLRAIHLCEYGAQAAAVHGGMMARANGEPMRRGFLVALRDIRLYADYVHDLSGELTVTASRLQTSVLSSQYSFEVRHGQELLIEGRIAIMTRED